MIVIGITGGTGCGKTTLLARVAARGGAIIDCDAVYHDLLISDQALLDAINNRFPGVVTGGVLDRKKLGKVVFEDAAALGDLNGLTHPAVDARVQQLLSAAQQEGRTLAAIDRVKRLMAREGISEEYARLRIAAQKSDGEFAAQCGRTICNDYSTAEGFSKACDRLLDQIIGGI